MPTRGLELPAEHFTGTVHVAIGEEQMHNFGDSRGFTLIELMIVVVIISVLAAMAIPRFTAVSDQAKQAEAAPILKQMCMLAEAEYLRENDWPASLGDIPGWTDPSAQHFSNWSFSNGVASATAGTGLQNPAMDCETKEITVGGV